MFDQVLPPDKIEPGDSISTDTVTYQITAPNDVWIQNLLLGLIYSYCLTSAWYQGIAEVTVPQAVELFNQIWESFHVVSNVGTIVLYAGASLPPDLLACDGSSYLRSTYPLLFSVIGTTWGSMDSSHFNVPDLRGRATIGAGSGTGLTPRTLGAVGGEETHVLTVAELAAHTHSIPSTLTSLAVQPGDLPVLDPSILPAFSGSTGSDAPHNNMQPFGVIVYAIRST